MANLVFSDLQNEVYAHTGLDSTDSTNSTNVNRWINYTQQDFCAQYPWPFMASYEQIITTQDATDGTVTATNGSATIIGTAGNFNSTHANGQFFVQFSTANNWYQVKTYNSSTSITLDQVYLGTSAAGLSYILRRFYTPLSSSADRIIDVRNWNTPLKLVQVDARTVDDIRPNPQSTNSSYGYIAYGYDTNGNILISPYPFPSDVRIISFRTIKRPTDMSSGSDVPSIPNKYAHVLAWGAISIGFAFLRRFEEASAWSQKFKTRISEIKKEYRLSEDYQPVLRSIDSIQRSKWISLPEQYPILSGQ